MMTRIKRHLNPEINHVSIYLLPSLAAGFAVDGCAGRKFVPALTGLFPPFGFFTSRFRLPRPLAIAVLPIG
jgi:hypothetical protein